MKRSAGFTLIELVVVIVLLGILAAVAVPKFTGLSVDARNASAAGVAGAISSGSAINYGSYVARNGDTTKGVFAVSGSNAQVCTIDTLGNFVSGVSLKSGTAKGNSEFDVSGGSSDCTGGGSTVTCKITAPSDGTTPTTAQVATVTCTGAYAAPAAGG